MPQPDTAPLVIFDLDGTLVDTSPDLVASLNHTITAEGLEPVTYEDLTHLVGQGVHMMIRRAYAMHERDLDDATLARLFDRFMAFYLDTMPGDSHPYPGVVEALDRLAGAGMKLAVCTNKIESLTFPLLEKLGLGGRFAAITGGDTYAFRKPDARHILGTIEKAGGTPARSIMIGDSVNDIAAAQNAAIRSIAVPFGYSDVPVETLGADRIITHFDELTPALIEDLLN
ncbi:phosphoglycolate phosphatase [Rhizobiaceae bacterium BDR2-2]|uniref:Phosphoglycolate phosphatase n=1 Tax=Ectorhizobium quercum TaxID=2965071 RepID=A0AAE3N414_9HYPH|nr:HAD family hydrolase [Ectorhizobium quercum]MCX8999836.1 phosphoglycolate phosphatase [Ectorhizobium quercum]